ncbi:MAG TPA: formylmethionine deformylase, partial [Synergistaceae bacterium]|nr:formylmethionine deformylase [Synergistaceae bacterium]
MIREILLLGDPRLYETSAPVTRSDVSELAPVVEDLHDTLLEFRRRYGAG